MPTTNDKYLVEDNTSWLVLNKIVYHRLWGNCKEPIIHIDLDDYYECDYDDIYDLLLSLKDKLNEGIITEEEAKNKITKDEYDDKPLMFFEIQSIYVISKLYSSKNIDRC